ncbi:MAG: FtsX-like permease family protein [bacterium]|nr:FtsX-like permease family protein [bacterium]
MKDKVRKPPAVLVRILNRLIDYRVSYDALGEFEERYYSIINRSGYLIAVAWYLCRIFFALPDYIFNSFYRSSSMLQNYFKIAFRNIKRHKVFSLINISSLAIGMACFILMLIWVTDELNYDSFFDNSDRIYRICSRGKVGDTVIRQTLTPAPLPATLISDFPDVEKAVRLSYKMSFDSKFEENVFNEKNVIFADSSFLDVFSFKLIDGKSERVLNEPGTGIITESVARKYFGDENPLGKSLILNDGLNIRIDGVINDMPRNSHFHFDIIISMSTNNIRNNDWRSNNFITYLVLREGASREQFEAKLPDFVIKYIGSGYADWMQWIEKGNSWEYFLQPLTRIHLISDLWAEYEPNGNIAYVYIFSVSAVLIMLVACFNFVNLSTARSACRAREIGMRKVVGSTRRQLIIQILNESVLYSMIAVILSLIIIYSVMPVFNNMANKQFELGDFINLQNVLILSLFAIFIGLLSGSYPSLYLSGLRPVAIIKGKVEDVKNKNILRNSLIIFQFSISVLLLICTFIIGNQLDYMQNKNLGFNKEQVLTIRNSRSLKQQKTVFKDELKQYSGISAVSGTYSIPGGHFVSQGFRSENSDPIVLNIGFCEPEYIDVMQLTMLQGRFFSRDFETDLNSIVINRRTADLLNWDNPIGKEIASREFNLTFTVIGVMEDMHYASLHHIVQPMALLLVDLQLGWPESYISVRFDTENVMETIAYIEDTWKSFVPDMPFEYSFLENDYYDLYKNERYTGKLFVISSMLAIFIAVLGLYGLTSFVIGKREKEMGIRKVLGARNSKIFILLSLDFIKWIALANIIAWPAAYFATESWLNNFAFRTAVDWKPFLISGFLSVFIALIIISGQSIKTAMANPVDSLRYE